MEDGDHRIAQLTGHGPFSDEQIRELYPALRRETLILLAVGMFKREPDGWYLLR